MTVQAWLATSDADGFARSLGWRLRGWFLGLPAGIGLATLRACVKLLIGFPPSRSGVWSAGNGPAMRAPALALVDGDLRAYVRASTRITHTDPKAEVASYVLALAARQALRGECDLGALREDADDELGRALDVAVEHLSRGASAEQYADAIGLAGGVTGYIHHTVPAALYAWARHRGDFRATVTAAVDLGGDTDSVGAVAGALAGATVGLGGLPPRLARRLRRPSPHRRLDHAAGGRGRRARRRRDGRRSDHTTVAGSRPAGVALAGPPQPAGPRRVDRARPRPAASSIAPSAGLPRTCGVDVDAHLSPRLGAVEEPDRRRRVVPSYEVGLLG